MSNKNSNLSKAKKEKNDEFYTQLIDIEKEVKHYHSQLKDKVIYCNCDQAHSNFVKYFKDNKDIIGYKDFLYNATDFRGEQSIELLKQSDIVITNPAFSLFREYIAQLIEYDKKFLVIGSMNAITYKEIFKLIKEDKIWLGYNMVKEFTQPDGSIKKFGNINWFTNLETKKRKEELILYREYNEIDYPKYDNYDAINCDKTKDIPKDMPIDTIFGVPITFLDKYSPTQFEIIGQMVSTTIDNFNFGYPYVNGSKIYARILIKKRYEGEVK